MTRKGTRRSSSGVASTVRSPSPARSDEEARSAVSALAECMRTWEAMGTVASKAAAVLFSRARAKGASDPAMGERDAEYIHAGRRAWSQRGSGSDAGGPSHAHRSACLVRCTTKHRSVGASQNLLNASSESLLPCKSSRSEEPATSLPRSGGAASARNSHSLSAHRARAQRSGHTYYNWRGRLRRRRRTLPSRDAGAAKSKSNGPFLVLNLCWVVGSKPPAATIASPRRNPGPCASPLPRTGPIRCGPRAAVVRDG